MKEHTAPIDRCESCEAAIIWALTESGKRIPIDVKQRDDGNIIVDAGIARVVAPGEGTHVSHFATCPNASKHRRKR